MASWLTAVWQDPVAASLRATEVIAGATGYRLYLKDGANLMATEMIMTTKPTL